MTEPINLGPKLKPPHGGLARLQQMVQQQQTRRLGPKGWVTAATTASLVALSVLLIWGPGKNQQRRIHRAVQQALRTPPRTYFDNAAYIVLPSRRRNVRILLVASLPRSQPSSKTR